MTVLAEKTKQTVILMGEFILGILIAVGALVAMPVLIFSTTGLIHEPMLLVVVFGTALFFAGFSYLLLIRPYLLYKRLPDIQAETDGKFLYIHSKKEAMIPLCDLDGAYLFATPENLAIHLLADGYGRVDIELASGEKYKLYFISNANQVPTRISSLIKFKFV